MKISRAYSLVELSIVILIIGVLIGGITEGTKLLKKSKLRVARALTSSSFAVSAKDMILWLDATAEGSMVNASGSVKVEEGNTVQTWNDVNPQVNPLSRFSFTQGTDSKRPTYEDNGINGLPTLYFNATTDTNGKALSQSYSSILHPAAFTVFAAVRPIEALSADAWIFTSYDSFGVMRGSNYNSYLFGYVSGSVNYVNSNTPIQDNISYVYSASSDGAAQKIYHNGVLKNSSSFAYTASSDSSDPSIVGSRAVNASATCFDGYLSEIIIYSRVLKERERKAIEKYLGKKYGILVS